MATSRTSSARATSSKTRRALLRSIHFSLVFWQSLPSSVWCCLYRCMRVSMCHLFVWIPQHFQVYRLSHHLCCIFGSHQLKCIHADLVQDLAWTCCRTKYDHYSCVSDFLLARIDGRTSWNPQSAVHNNWHSLRLPHGPDRRRLVARRLFLEIFDSAPHLPRTDPNLHDKERLPVRLMRRRYETVEMMIET